MWNSVYIYISVRVYKRVRNCVRERGPVRCYFTGSNCRRKHSKHRHRPRLVPTSIGARSSTDALFSQFYFIPVHHRECLIAIHVRPPALAPLRPIDREISTPERRLAPAGCSGEIEFEINCPSSLSDSGPIRGGIRFYGESLVGKTRLSIIAAGA